MHYLVLRDVARIEVQDGAVDPRLTVERRNALLVRHRQALIAARKHFTYVKTIITDGYYVAFKVLGGCATDDLMTAEERKRLEEARRKRKEELSWMAMAGGPGRRGNLLPMALETKKFKRDKSNAPCFNCK